MKKKIIIILGIIVGIIILIIIAGIVKFNFSDNDIIILKPEEVTSPTNKLAEKVSEIEAIKIIKDRYLELEGYPNTNFPVKSIKTEESDNGWYVAFIQEGSGIPIINARCFEIQDNKNIIEKRYTRPDNYNLGEFSAKECMVIKTSDKVTVPKVEIACTMDAMECPDGSYVGRSVPNCKFVCPQ